MAFGVTVNGLEVIPELKAAPARVRTAASRALNRTARDQRTVAARRIGEQLALPKNLLAPRSGRIEVVEPASPAKLQTRIRARGRPTSLARFIRGGHTRGRGVLVEVKPGQLRRLPRAFPIRLRRGATRTETQFNLGLAIRLRPGERVNNRRLSSVGFDGLTLLYGPSVQQVFLDNSGRGVARDIEDQTADKLAREFARLLRL